MEAISRRESIVYGVLGLMVLFGIGYDLFESSGSITLETSEWRCTSARPVAMSGSSIKAGFTGGKVGQGYTIIDECDTYTRRASMR